MKKLSTLCILSFVFFMMSSVYASDRGNTWNDSFSKAKKILEYEVYKDHRTTFYCGCPFDEHKVVQSCQNYTPVKEGKRSGRVEWDHVVPAAHFGQSFREWREGDPQCMDNKGKAFKGRNCASRAAVSYRLMESDMYNLVPAVGEVNGLRSNYRFGMVAGKGYIEVCGMKIDKEARTAEPPKRVTGNIARTYKYMDKTYPDHGIIGKSNEKLFDAWDREDPVDKWECERCKRIEGIQGNENPIVKEQCRKAGLW